MFSDEDCPDMSLACLKGLHEKLPTLSSEHTRYNHNTPGLPCCRNDTCVCVCLSFLMCFAALVRAGLSLYVCGGGEGRGGGGRIRFRRRVH
jgi:hypothetical protein